VRGATLIPRCAHVLTGRHVPLTLGHEVSGVVEYAGSRVRSLRTGDHVAIQPILSDATCYACKQNRPNCCEKQGFYGLSEFYHNVFGYHQMLIHKNSGADGGLAEYLVVQESNARLIPSNMPLDVAGKSISPMVSSRSTY
jgi:threonine dehydrogenase-like Zn-dependent dehydrogenase